MRTRSATYPDRETAQWATQAVVTANPPEPFSYGAWFQAVATALTGG
ncbi:hypothetical protein [Streptomyces sp. NPDC006459]